MGDMLVESEQLHENVVWGAHETLRKMFRHEHEQQTDKQPHYENTIVMSSSFAHATANAGTFDSMLADAGNHVDLLRSR